MKILVIPNPFKESLSSRRVCSAIKKGILNVCPKASVITIPIADGGDGTLDAFKGLDGTQTIKYKAYGPLGNKINSEIIILKKQKTAVIEMALVSGLALVPDKKRNPMKTTTFGLGQLIKKALDFDIKKIIIGLGGSATVDGGIGMAQALGIEINDKNNKPVNYGGQGLKQIYSINIDNKDKRIDNIEFIGACDVENPLTGKYGAVNVYARQKGASQSQMQILETSMKNYAGLIKKDLNIDIKKIKGVGSAGGLGAGLMAFLGARLESGFDIISKLFNIEEKIKSSDIIITGEGKLDKQSFYGKVPGKVMNLCQKHKKPLICVAGILSDELKNIDLKNTACFSILRDFNLKKQVFAKSEEYLTAEIENIFKLI